VKRAGTAGVGPSTLVAGLACAVCLAAVLAAGRGVEAQEATAALPPGTRAGTAAIAIVGGNTASARERALDEALRQAVSQALSEQLEPQTRAAQARGIKALEARARSYVKRYRTVEEGEAGGFYNLRVEAEIDDVALRRATERWTVSGPAPAPGAARPAALAWLVVVSGPSDAGPALVGALSSLGIHAQTGDAGLTDPGRALQAAARAALSAVAFLSATVTDEGMVRGPGQIAVSCQLAVKVVAAPGGQALAEQSANPRSFSDRESAARADCLARAAAAIAPRLLPAGRAPAASGGDLRVVVLDADVIEPSVVAALLKTVRGLGSVSAADVRRIAAGRAEIRVRTRLSAPALGTALARENAALIVLSDLTASGDLIRLRARLRPPPPPAATPGLSDPASSANP
jgi:hypothetical protein